MHYPARTLAYVCELLHPPVAGDPAAIQKLHNKLFASGSPAYTSFAVTQAGTVLSNPTTRPGAVSAVAFLADRIQFREELGSITWEEFAVRVRGISEEVARLRNLSAFLAQQVTVRTLVNPRASKDSRAFLKDHLLGFGDELEAFGRAPAFYGLRMVFPAVGESVTSETNNAFVLRLESYNNDVRSLYLENQGTFGGMAVEPGGLGVLEQNIEATYRFVTERAVAFVRAFDERAVGERRRESGGAEGEAEGGA